MAVYAWNPLKNEWLIQERGVSFERVVFCIEHGRLLDVILHPNPAKYPKQKMFVVDIDDYAYLVPFVESEEQVFLKTVIPSRKATRQYLRGNDG